MAWFGIAKMALQAGAKIYTNRQNAKVAMSEEELERTLLPPIGKDSKLSQTIGTSGRAVRTYDTPL